MSVLDLIGDTPLVEVDGILVKVESRNPSGSIKDRLAKYIVEHETAAGRLRRGQPIVEASSGNTGIAFSLVGAATGHAVVICMPAGLTPERASIMKAFGAAVALTPKRLSVAGAVAEAARLGRRMRAFQPRQFANPLNAHEHLVGLGREILREAGRVDAFVAGVGTGGTLVGAGLAIRRKFPKAKLFAVEPHESPVLAGGKSGPHHIEGIGDGFVPPLFAQHQDLIDGIIRITSAAALREARRLAREEGYFVGPSSGANLLAAKIVRRRHPRLRRIVTLFPDSGDRYLSLF